jgi:hypothetical protein
VGPNEVVKEDVESNKGISRLKGFKAPFGLVPGFKLTVEGFYDVVRNVISKVFNSEMYFFRK